MMKLSITLLVIAIFISTSNGASCSMNTKLSDTCGSITISGVNNGDYDGTYNRIDDCLFQKQDGSEVYLSYWYGRGGVYVGVEEGDRRCESSTGSYGLRFDAELLDNLGVGDEEEMIATWPRNRAVKVSCDSASTEQAAPVEGLGSICLTTDSTATLSAGSGIEVDISRLAGQYVEISGGINGFPAYELVNTGSACSESSTLMYISGQYLFVRDRTDPFNTYYFGCDNADAIANNDISGGCTGDLQDHVGFTLGSSCQCGRTTPTPTTPAFIPIETDSLCYATTETAKNERRSANNVELSTIAGQYKLIDESDENGKPIYELTGCGTTAYIKYVSWYSLFMVVTDVNDGRNTYTTWCTNTADITDNDILKCEWTNNEDYVITNNLVSCSCGQTVPDDIP